MLNIYIKAYVRNFRNADINIGLITLLAQAMAIKMPTSIPSETFISYTRDNRKYKEQMLKIQHQLHEKDAYVSISRAIPVLIKCITHSSLGIIPCTQKD